MKKISYFVIVIILAQLFITGCAKKSFIEQKSECISKGGKFELEKSLNIFAFKEEIIGKCY